MPLHPLHSLWRALPAEPRRRWLAHGLASLAPRPDRVPPPTVPGLAVAGELDRASGLGEGARLMLMGLKALGVPGWEVRPGDAVPPAGVPLVVHLAPPAYTLALCRLGRAMIRGRRIIGYWAWELPVAPASWRIGLDLVHEVWTPSNFSAAALEPLLPGRVRVVPHPVAVRFPVSMSMPVPLCRAALGLPTDAVVTFVSFNLASSFVRKNPLGAIAAHAQAFGADPDRVLLLRVVNPDHFPADMAALSAAAAPWPNIRLDTRTLSAAEHWGTMAACDIVLSLHRSEGFGLVPAEALLLGIPVVATDWSGTQDFLTPDGAALVPARLVPAVDPRGIYAVPGAQWAEPDITVAVRHLVRLAADPAARRALGQAGQHVARARLGTDGLLAALI